MLKKNKRFLYLKILFSIKSVMMPLMDAWKKTFCKAISCIWSTVSTLKIFLMVTVFLKWCILTTDIYLLVIKLAYFLQCIIFAYIVESCIFKFTYSCSYFHFVIYHKNVKKNCSQLLKDTNPCLFLVFYCIV